MCTVAGFGRQRVDAALNARPRPLSSRGSVAWCKSGLGRGKASGDSGGVPVAAQQEQDGFWQRHIAITLALALAYVHQLALPVHGIHRQPDAFLQPQSAAIDRARQTR